MSATEIINELSKLSEAERQEVLSKLRDLVHQDEEIAACNHPAAEGAAPLNRLEETGTPYQVVDLQTRGIGKVQAGDLRTRLKTFAEDWDRPEASIYDEDPAR